MRKIDIGKLLSKLSLLKRKRYLKFTSLLLVFLIVFQCMIIPPPKAYAGESSWPTLQYGSGGSNVVAVQYLLRLRGYDISVDGDYGPGTAGAVQDFQSWNGLDADGICGPSTLGQLIDFVAYGNGGDGVRACQYLLANKFQAQIDVDGICGPATDSAIRLFQSSQGLYDDGAVGYETWRCLFGADDYPGQIAFLDNPQDGTSFTSTLNVNGWALNYYGISSVDVLIDGNVIGQASYGAYRPDVQNDFPNYPNATCSGFNYTIDINSISKGSHTLTTQYTGINGTVTSDSVTIYADNPSVGQDQITPVSGFTRYDDSSDSNLFLYNNSVVWGNGDTYNFINGNVHAPGDITKDASVSFIMHGTQFYLMCQCWDGGGGRNRNIDVYIDGSYRETFSAPQYLINGHIVYYISPILSDAYHSISLKYHANTGEMVFDGIDIKGYLVSPDTTPPTTPSNLKNVSKTGNSIALSWTPSTDNYGVIGYYIYRNGVQIGTTSSASYNDTGLTQYTSYTYTIAAYDALGNVSAQCSALPVKTNDTEAPIIPSNLKCVTKAGTYIYFTWTPSTDNSGVIGYYIYRDGVKIGTTASTGYTDAGLKQYTSYIYAIAAYDTQGNVSPKCSALAVKTDDTVAPSIVLSSSNSWGVTNTITANITDVGSGVNYSSLKWALGDLPASYFATKGNSFTGTSFSVSQNGIYTVYAKDNVGNMTIQRIAVNYVYTPAPIGNFTQSFTDLSVTSPGMDAVFGRVYNSANKTVGLFGNGWTFSYEGSVKNYQYTYTDASGKVQSATMSDHKIVKLPDGSQYTYIFTNGVYVAYDTRNTLVHNADDTYTVTTIDKKSYTFNLNGYLTSIKDLNNNTVVIAVDTNGKVQTVTDSVGRVYRIAYNGAGTISTITDPIGRVITYSYENGNLYTVADPTNTIVYYFEYDSRNYLCDISDMFWYTVSSITYWQTTQKNDGMISSYADSKGNIEYLTYDFTLGNNQKKTTGLNKDNKAMYVTYNAENRIINTVDEDLNTITYAYNNAYGDLGSITYNDKITTYQYDASGKQTKAINSDITKVVYTYDSNGNILSSKDANNNFTFYQYDNKGNLLKQATPKDGTIVAYDNSEANLVINNNTITGTNIYK